MIASAVLIVNKDRIKRIAIEEINKYMNKKIHVGYVDIAIWKTFPNLSLDFQNVLIHDKFGEMQTADTALFAESIRLRFNPIELINGNYNLERIDIFGGKFNMRIREDGSLNYDFIKSSAEQDSTAFELELEHIHVHNTSYLYHNKASQQYYHAHIHDMDLKGAFKDEAFTLNAKTDFKVAEVRNKAISLVQNKDAELQIEVLVNSNENRFEIQTADLRINELPFYFKGAIVNDFIDFKLGSNALPLKDFVQQVQLKELDVIEELKATGLVDIDVHIEGEMNYKRPPAIDATFSVDNGSITDRGIAISDIQLKGVYGNGIKTGVEHLILENVRFKSLGSAFNGEARITDFAQPRIRGKMKGDLDLAAVHRLFAIQHFRELSGQLNTNGTFDIQLNNPTYNPSDITVRNLNAEFGINNIVMTTDSYTMPILLKEGIVVIRNQEAVLKNVFIESGDSDVEVDGTFKNIVDYFNQSKDLVVKAYVESNRINVDGFSDQTTSDISPRKQWVLPRNLAGNVHVRVNEIQYSNHFYKAIDADMRFIDRGFYFSNLRGENAGAKVAGNLKIQEEYPMKIAVQTSLKSSSISFDKLFEEWNNFDQDVITASSIRGNASVDLFFSGVFDLFEQDLDKKGVNASATIQITDGALNNVESFKAITESLRDIGATRLLISNANIDAFERELSQLKFQRLENKIFIEDGVITIPKMAIYSNALNLNLSGTHTFDNVIDYSFDFRFRDLKSSAKSSEFGDIIDDDTGFKVFLKMTGTIDEPVFEWDKEQFKTARKEKREDAKEELKSVLKSGFGINKKDSTVREATTEPVFTEKIIMDFDNDTLKDVFDKKEKEKRKSKLRLKIDQWQEETEKEKEVFEILD